MTDQTTDSGTAPQPTTDPRDTGPPRRLERTVHDKVLAGVAGGLGRYFGVDPLLVRIVLVLLAVFGGFGVMFYVAAWLLIPEEGTGRTVIGSLSTGRRNAAYVLGAALVAAGLFVALSQAGFWFDEGFPWVPLAVAVGLLLLWRRPDAQPTRDAPGDSLAGAAEPDAGARRSVLVPVTLSILLILTGVAALLDVTGALDVAWDAFVAVSLMIVGLAMLVGARWGRARALIWVGVVLAPLLAVLTFVDLPLRGGVGERVVRPATAAEASGVHRLAMGSLTIDLSDLSVGEQAVDVDASVAVGELRILVPSDARVRVDASVRAGQLDVFGEVKDGLDVISRAARESLGRAAPEPPGSSGLVNVRARVGLGELEVHRDAS